MWGKPVTQWVYKAFSSGVYHDQRMNVTTYFLLVLWLRMYKAMLSLPLTSSWFGAYARDKFTLTLVMLFPPKAWKAKDTKSD
jgi:hypothetical protein